MALSAGNDFLTVTHVTKSYGVKSGETVLHDVSLTVNAGEFVAIKGPSGSGKTTLLNLIGGLDRHYTGQIRVAGQDIATLSDRKMSRLRNEFVGFVFQQFHLLDHLTCLENVVLPARFASATRATANVMTRARELLDWVSLGHRADQFAAALSGGERQRVAIARALLLKPALLLCDEPTGNLDQHTGQAIIDLFVRQNRAEKTTVLVVTHEPRVSDVAGRVVEIRDGKIAVAA